MISNIQSFSSGYRARTSLSHYQSRWLGSQVNANQIAMRIVSNNTSSAPGIYYGTLNFTSGVDDFIDAAQLMPFPTLSPADDSPLQSPSTPTVPLSIAVTEFHFILLYFDRIVAVSRLDERVTHEELLPLVRLPFPLKRICG